MFSYLVCCDISIFSTYKLFKLSQLLNTSSRDLTFEILIFLKYISDIRIITNIFYF